MKGAAQEERGDREQAEAAAAMPAPAQLARLEHNQAARQAGRRPGAGRHVVGRHMQPPVGAGVAAPAL
jgi:hypothetical protein